MAHVVGPKGQVVIEKQIRDQLGVGRGWKAVQRLVDDHVELRFIPPTHNRSLAGVLAPFVEGTKTSTDEEVDAAVERAVGEDWARKERYMRRDDARPPVDQDAG